MVIRALGKREFQEVEALFLASACLVAIGRGMHPTELLSCVAESFAEDDWEAIKESILLEQFERQLAA